MFAFTVAKPCVSGLKVAGITGPPLKPPSTTSAKRVSGVYRLLTWVRSTPGRKNTSSVRWRSASKYFGVKMSPFLASSEISSTLPPPNCASTFL